MKQILMIALIGFFGVNFASANTTNYLGEKCHPHPKCKKQKRVRQAGIKNLSHRELSQIKRNEAQLQRAKRRAKSDGFVGPYERKQIQIIKQRNKRKLKRDLID